MIKFNDWYHYNDMGASIDSEIDTSEITEEEYEYLEKNKLCNLSLNISICANDDEGCIDPDEDGSLNFRIRLYSYSEGDNSIFEKDYKKLNSESLEEVNSILRSHDIEEVELSISNFLEYLCQDN